MNRPCQNLLSCLIAIAFALMLVATVDACPTCKESLGENSVNLVRGFGWSIIFMMATPFLILAGVGGYFYYEIRKARDSGQLPALGNERAQGPVVSDAT